MKRSQLAINSVSTTNQNLEDALAAYQAAGFANVEFCLPIVKQWLVATAGRTPDDVRALLGKHKLRSIGGFEGGVECFSPAAQRAKNHESTLANAQLIHDLGGGTLVVGTDGPTEAPPSVDALNVVADTFAQLAKKIEGKNVTIAIEFNWSPLIKSLRAAAAVARKVAHPQIGVLFDPAHYFCTSTKTEDLNAENVKWIKHVHMNDMRDKPGDLSNCNADRVLPGQGTLDLKDLISRLERHGYNGFVSIEMFSDELWNLSARDAAKKCYDSLIPYCAG